MRLCKDCKYFTTTGTLLPTPLCGHEKALKYDDPIFGDHQKKTCKEMRENNDYCGITGKLWISSALFTKQEHSSI